MYAEIIAPHHYNTIHRHCFSATPPAKLIWYEHWTVTHSRGRQWKKSHTPHGEISWNQVEIM